MGIFKKSLAVALAALMLVSVFTVAAFAAPAEGTYIVAGVAGLCGGDGWAPADTANQMTAGDDGIYSITYKDVAVANEDYAFKVTDGSWDNAWGKDGNNFLFNVTETSDVTITFDPATETVSVIGDKVVTPSGLDIKNVIAVGNSKKTTFLNGLDWAVADESNAMSTEDGKVYTITYKGVEAADDLQVKFAINGSWNSNFGALKDGNADGVSLQWDGDNINFDVELAKADVTLTLDLTNFDYENGKTGATYKIDVVEAAEEATTAAPEETTAAPEETTVAPEETTVAPEETTAAPTEAPEKPATPDTPDTPATPDTPDTPDQPTTAPEKPVVPGFYVVGSEEVCGAEWGWDAPWNYGEPMQLSADGVTYYQVFENIKASAGNITDEGNDIYVFKVVYVDEKGSITWHPGGMGNNTCVTVAEDGSTILFQFKLLASKPTKEGSDPEAVIATVYGPNDEKPADWSKVAYPEAPTEPETTVAPTTVEPTTVAPTTVAPTQPTTKKVAAKKKANTIKVKAKKVTIKAKNLKKKAQKVKITKALKVTKAKGTVTYAKVKKGSTKKFFKKVTIKKKSGKITIKKGKLKKGTYKLKIKVTAAGNKSYKKKSVTKVVKFKVK